MASTTEFVSFFLLSKILCTVSLLSLLTDDYLPNLLLKLVEPSLGRPKILSQLHLFFKQY